MHHISINYYILFSVSNRHVRKRELLEKLTSEQLREIAKAERADEDCYVISHYYLKPNLL